MSRLSFRGISVALVKIKLYLSHFRRVQRHLRDIHDVLIHVCSYYVINMVVEGVRRLNPF